MSGDAVLCTSCERHRADGHAPRWTLYGDAEFCHGAGYNGQQHHLLPQRPRAIVKVRAGSRKNPHVYREDACLNGEDGA